MVIGNDRALDVIDALVERAGTESGAGAWGVRELAQHLQANRSTVNRVLQGLTAGELAQADDNGNYAVGRRLRVLMHSLYLRHASLGRARKALDRLGDRCEATAMLAIQGPQDGRAFAALVHARPGPVRYNLTPGMSLPLHAGAAGRAILLELGVHALDHTDLTRFSQDTVTERPRLAAELAAAAGRAS